MEMPSKLFQNSQLGLNTSNVQIDSWLISFPEHFLLDSGLVFHSSCPTHHLLVLVLLWHLLVIDHLLPASRLILASDLNPTQVILILWTRFAYWKSFKAPIIYLFQSFFGDSPNLHFFDLSLLLFLKIFRLFLFVCLLRPRRFGVSSCEGSVLFHKFLHGFAISDSLLTIRYSGQKVGIRSRWFQLMVLFSFLLIFLFHFRDEYVFYKFSILLPLIECFFPLEFF